MNHAQEARDLLQPLQALAGKDAAFDLELAQVHATLALAEQQRIANVIALTRIECENDYTPRDALKALYDVSEPRDLHTNLNILEALELGDQQ